MIFYKSEQRAVERGNNQNNECTLRLLLRSTYFIMHSFATAAALRMRTHIHDLCVLVLHAYITMIMMMK